MLAEGFVDLLAIVGRARSGAQRDSPRKKVSEAARVAPDFLQSWRRPGPPLTRSVVSVFAGVAANDEAGCQGLNLRPGTAGYTKVTEAGLCDL